VPGSCGHLKYDAATPEIATLGLGVAALDYQRAGYAVLPLIRGGKKPHRMLPETGGVHHGSLLERDVRAWWSADPAANIGVATGIVSRLMVIDLDVKGGSNGPQGFAIWLLNESKELPAGCYVKTPSGGVHLWFRTPAGKPVPERPGILPGVDIKGNGGLVVAAPSMQLTSSMMRPGEQGGEQVPVPYDAHGCPLCQVPLAPPWLLDWAATAVSTGSARQAEHQDDSLDLEHAIKHGIPMGQRNHTLYRLACQLYRKHGTGPASADLVIGQIQLAWSASDRTDMPWREVLVTVESARRFIQQAERNDQIMMQQTIGWLGR
jgi:hypothetical protein